MTFQEALNGYIARVDTTFTRLAKEAGISPSAVSRYVKGEREPAYDSGEIDKLASAVVRLGEEEGLALEAGEVRAALSGAVRGGVRVPYEAYLANLRRLMKALDIRGGALAKALAYDPSYISKLLSGQRRPGDIAKFSGEVGAYVAQHFSGEGDRAVIARLTGCGAAALDSAGGIRDAVAGWLGTNVGAEEVNPVGHFLEKLDDFRLDEFIRAIHFDDIRLPTAPFQLPVSKTYEGIQAMMACELDFIRATVLSRSKEDCILYSDMPLEQMAGDPEFPKKWMFGMAMLLKKGLHLHIIHDVNRPFDEMMLGLEGNIPMYMTGQISPYYLPRSQSGVFTHLLKVSGAAAMTGSAIAGYQAEGRYRLTKSADEVRHYRLRAQRLLEKARPLMDIYRSDRAEEYAAQLRLLWRKGGEWRVISGSLPVYTMPETLLDAILTRNGVPESEARAVRELRRARLAAVEALPDGSRITLEVPTLTEAQFGAYPLHLALADLFLERDVPYTYGEYQAHLRQTEAFAAARPNVTLKGNGAPTFRNISITIVGDGPVIVSKSKSPTIHFVIHHKRMVQAFRSFLPPLREP